MVLTHDWPATHQSRDSNILLFASSFPLFQTFLQHCIIKLAYVSGFFPYSFWDHFHQRKQRRYFGTEWFWVIFFFAVFYRDMFSF